MSRNSGNVSVKGEPAPAHETVVHTEIGNRPGVIVELREEGDFPSERDMTHLRDEDARELYEQLASYFGEEPSGVEVNDALSHIRWAREANTEGKTIKANNHLNAATEALEGISDGE